MRKYKFLIHVIVCLFFTSVAISEEPKVYYDTDLEQYKSGREEDNYRYNQEILQQREKEKNTLEMEREIEERTLRQKEEKVCGKCEITSYTQFERNLGGGVFSGMSDGLYVSGVIVGEKKETCVNIVIKNSDCEVKTIASRNITATTSKGNTVNPKGIYLQLAPGERYDGTICFGRKLSPIVKLELQ